jgi:hypothetical protein
VTPAATAGTTTGAPRRASAPRRPPLEVVSPRSARRRPRLAPFLSAVLLLGALLIVVGGHAMLAAGQVRLSTVQQDLTQSQATYRKNEIATAQKETPARIVSEAESRGMIHPTVVNQLPFVPLNVPLATPKVTPAPVAPPTTSASTTATSGGTSTSTTVSATGGTTPSETGTGTTGSSGQ